MASAFAMLAVFVVGSRSVYLMEPALLLAKPHVLNLNSILINSLHTTELEYLLFKHCTSVLE